MKLVDEEGNEPENEMEEEVEEERRESDTKVRRHEREELHEGVLTS